MILYIQCNVLNNLGGSDLFLLFPRPSCALKVLLPPPSRMESLKWAPWPEDKINAFRNKTYAKLNTFRSFRLKTSIASIKLITYRCELAESHGPIRFIRVRVVRVSALDRPIAVSVQLRKTKRITYITCIIFRVNDKKVLSDFGNISTCFIGDCPGGSCRI